jgi:hypothetical protein
MKALRKFLELARYALYSGVKVSEKDSWIYANIGLSEPS